MERTLEIMLKESIINKETLLQIRHNLIGLNKEQTLLILNIFAMIRDNVPKITVVKIANSYNWKRTEVERILSELAEHKVVVPRMKDGAITFNFRNLWDRLLQTYLTPVTDAKPEEVIEWVARMLEIRKSPAMKTQITKWVKSAGAKRIISVVEMIFKLNKERSVDWQMFKSLYLANSENKKADETKLKQIAEFDWLSK